MSLEGPKSPESEVNILTQLDAEQAVPARMQRMEEFMRMVDDLMKSGNFHKEPERLEPPEEELG